MAGGGGGGIMVCIYSIYGKERTAYIDRMDIHRVPYEGHKSIFMS